MIWKLSFIFFIYQNKLWLIHCAFSIIYIPLIQVFLLNSYISFLFDVSLLPFLNYRILFIFIVQNDSNLEAKSKFYINNLSSFHIIFGDQAQSS